MSDTRPGNLDPVNKMGKSDDFQLRTGPLVSSRLFKLVPKEDPNDPFLEGFISNHFARRQFEKQTGVSGKKLLNVAFATVVLVDNCSSWGYDPGLQAANYKQKRNFEKIGVDVLSVYEMKIYVASCIATWLLKPAEMTLDEEGVLTKGGIPRIGFLIAARVPSSIDVAEEKDPDQELCCLRFAVEGESGMFTIKEIHPLSELLWNLEKRGIHLGDPVCLRLQQEGSDTVNEEESTDIDSDPEEGL